MPTAAAENRNDERIASAVRLAWMMEKEKRPASSKVSTRSFVFGSARGPLGRDPLQQRTDAARLRGAAVRERDLDVGRVARPVVERLRGLEAHVEAVVVPGRALAEDAAHDRVQRVHGALRRLHHEGDAVADRQPQLPGHGGGDEDRGVVADRQEAALLRDLRPLQLRLARGIDADDAGQAGAAARDGGAAPVEEGHRAHHALLAALALDAARQLFGAQEAVQAVRVERAVLRHEIERPRDDLHVAGLHGHQRVRELARDAVREAAAQHQRAAAQDHGPAREQRAPLGAQQVPERDGDERGHAAVRRTAGSRPGACARPSPRGRTPPGRRRGSSSPAP